MDKDGLALSRRELLALLAASTAASGDALAAGDDAAGRSNSSSTTSTGDTMSIALPPAKAQRLTDVDAELERILKESPLPPAKYEPAQITCKTVQVPMRDGIKLAADVYLPPVVPAPVVTMRTPYGRNWEAFGQTAAMMAMARRGYVVVAQDCRGTGGSEPDSWDYFVFEEEDGYDHVEWITKQEWYGGFVGSFGGSYVGQTQWHMGVHPRMSALVPSMCSLGAASNTVRVYMFLNAYAHTVGKGDKVPVPITEMERYFEKETMAGGFFNEPLHKLFLPALLERYPQLRKMPPRQAQEWLWRQYCGMTCAQRAAFIKQALGVKEVNSINFDTMTGVFGQTVSASALTFPRVDVAEVCRAMHAPPLIRTGWYDWHMNITLATWEALRRDAKREVAERARIIISPQAHNMPGYYVDGDTHPELLRMPSTLDQVGLMTRWYQAVQDGTTDRWPRVTYYLMGANEWRVADDWPVPDAKQAAFYMGPNGTLTTQPPSQSSTPDRYTYDPNDPTPTVGGSIVSFLYRPGSADVSEVQKRADVLTYTTAPLEHDLDVVGPLRMILYASSSALDTDFAVRLTDVFPDGRAIQLRLAMLRARYRNPAEPALLEPGRVYRLEVDMWATANRFKAGHRLRVDISSADFPHYDRNSNRGGEPGDPIPATQTIYHDPEHASHLLVSVLGKEVRA